MSDTSRTRPPEPKAIPVEDVDDLIHTATRLMQKEAAPDTLTADDVRRIGQELDIPVEYIDQALVKLEEQRQQEARAKEEAERRRLARRAQLRRYALGAGVGAAVLAGLLGASTLSVSNGLKGSLAEVAQKRAQVVNVRERREQVKARAATATPGPERDAELAGADNRVSIEQRRYDEVAARYNASASSFFASWVVGVSGLPASVPLSNQVSSW